METPKVNTSYGELEGVRERDIDGNEFYAFKGIPYAKPPIGQLRFQDPQPPESWTGTKNASKFGPSCCQYYLPINSYVGSDDCLYLNVYTKNLNSNAKLPVLFWIHGGAFYLGNGSDELYGPKFLLRKDVVLVTINYRLGVLGFLNLDDPEAAGNQGLKDQVMALKWVNSNISQFGGDTDNITIFGESAGSASVHYLCLSPTAKGLFHKAILQSGVANNPWAYILNPKSYGYRLAEFLGCDKKDTKEIIEFLKNANCMDLIQAQEKMLTSEEKKEKVFCGFGPSVDDKSVNPFLSIPIDEAIQSGIQVPSIIGYNNREGIVMLQNLDDRIINKIIKDIDKFLHPNVKKLLEKSGVTNNDLIKLYFEKSSTNNNNNIDLKENYVDMSSDLYFIHGIHEVIKIQTLKNSKNHTYAYCFTYDEGFSLIKMMTHTQMKGASHFDEVIYLLSASMFDAKNVTFDTISKNLSSFKWAFWNLSLWNPLKLFSFLFKYLSGAKPVKKGSSNYLMMEKMTELWVNFAKTGSPTPETTELLPVKWEPVENGDDIRHLVIHSNFKMENVQNFAENFSTQKNSDN